MITPVTSYSPSFYGTKKLNVQKAQKVVRKIVNLEKNAPKGITRTPMEFQDGNEEVVNMIKYLAGSCVGTSALTCVTEFSSGFSAGIAG